MASEVWKRELGIAMELSAWGTRAAKTDPADFQRFFGAADTWMTAEIIDLTGTDSDRNPVDAAPGNFMLRGGRLADIEIVPDRARQLLEALFGDEAGSNPYTYTPATALPSFTIWRRAGDIYYAVVGCKVQSIAFAFGLGTLKMSVELRGKGVEPVTEGDFPTIVRSTKRPFMFWGLACEYPDGTPIPIKEGSLTFANAMPDSDYYSGSRYTHEHREGTREVTGAIRITFDSYDRLTAFYTAAEKSLSLKATSPDGDTLEFTLPKIIHTADLDVSESENLYRLNMPFKAFKKTGEELITAVLTLTV
jgi:hypothetical protein